MESYDTETIFSLHRRLKYLVELMSLIQEPEPEYRRIFSLICWLIFSNRIYIETVDSKQPIYYSCLHPLFSYLQEDNRYRRPNQADEMDDSLDFLFGDDNYSCNNTPDYSNSEFMRNNTMYCDDETSIWTEETISPEEFSYPINDYIYPLKSIDSSEAEERSYDLDPSFFTNSERDPIINYYKLQSLYCTDAILSYRDRYMIQYFFHTEYTLGQIAFLNNDGSTSFFSNDDENQFREHLDDNLKKATLQVAKYVIKEELDYNLSAVTPSYDIRQMAPSWRIPDLFTGLYFSLFYMNSSQELFRLCANPSCRKPFRVETTRRNKKYCCDACRNAVGQRRYRNKKAK